MRGQFRKARVLIRNGTEFVLLHSVLVLALSAVFNIEPLRSLLFFCPLYAATNGFLSFWSRDREKDPWVRIIISGMVWALLFGLPFPDFRRGSFSEALGLNRETFLFLQWVFYPSDIYKVSLKVIAAYFWAAPVFALFLFMSTRRMIKRKSERLENELSRYKHQVRSTDQRLSEINDLKFELNSLRRALRRQDSPNGRPANPEFGSGGGLRHINQSGYVVTNGEFEHRLIAEAVLRRSLTSKEVVHHINGIRTDNRLFNLCVMSHRDHEHFHVWLAGHKKRKNKYPTFEEQRMELETRYHAEWLSSFN